MKITIDSYDGRGALDYTGALTGKTPLRIERKLNAPSVCTATLSPVAVMGGAAGAPARNGRVVVEADNGAVLFTGYLASDPASVYCGTGLEGAVYLTEISAISDDVVLDRMGIPPTAKTVGQQAAVVLGNLTSRTGASGVTLAPGGSTAVAGSFLPNPAEGWSQNAAELAAMSRAAYRVVNGQVSLASIGSTVHALNEADGSLLLPGLTTAQAKMLVNDVTVCGAEEPQAYVTEVFQGDGTTTAFQLSYKPYSITGQKSVLLVDLFQQAAVNPQFWTVGDPGARISVTATGLTVGGGDGLDGQTVVSSLDTFEMGGALLLEVTGVEVTAASDGYVGCFYNGTVRVGNLFAGFHVKESNGSQVVIPMVSGAEVGSTAALASGHQYTFRLRIHCRDVQRVLGAYYSVNDAGTSVYGGGMLAGQADLVFEVQDTTPGTPQLPVVLYDGSVQSAAAACTLTAVNSTNFFGSVRSIELKQSPTVWVTRVASGGSGKTVRLGLATEGADAKLTYLGKVTFFATDAPQAGDLVYVQYRVPGRSVARLASAASIAAQGGGLPGVSRLVCSVTVPATRSSADCENAALAMLDVATSRSAAWAGTYTAFNLHEEAGDVWPGDVLAVSAPSAGLQAELVARGVTVEYANATPELLQYKVAFANDWAEELALKVSHAVPKDAWLPLAAVAAPSALATLNNLSVTGVTNSAITVSAGVDAPAGGGFEVRRSDWKFQPGTDGDLVLRSPVANFTIPREAAVEQYFVRMYDGATPPNYSRFSSAVFVNVTL